MAASEALAHALQQGKGAVPCQPWFSCTTSGSPSLPAQRASSSPLPWDLTQIPWLSSRPPWSRPPSPLSPSHVSPARPSSPSRRLARPHPCAPTSGHSPIRAWVSGSPGTFPLPSPDLQSILVRYPHFRLILSNLKKNHKGHIGTWFKKNSNHSRRTYNENEVLLPSPTAASLPEARNVRFGELGCEEGNLPDIF